MIKADERKREPTCVTAHHPKGEMLLPEISDLIRLLSALMRSQSAYATRIGTGA
jgi:hypothetical protein